MSLLNVLAPVTLSAMTVFGALTPAPGLHGKPGTTSARTIVRDSTDSLKQDSIKKAEEDTLTPPLLGNSMRYGVDTAVSPCLDFYQYVNGDWRSKTRLGGTSTSQPKKVEFFSDTYRRTQQRLQVILDSARAVVATTKDPTLKALGTFYGSCMTSDSLERVPMRGARPKTKTPPKDSTRSEQCLQRTIASLGGAMGQAFAQELLATSAMTRMQQLLEAIRTAVIARIDNNPWMTASEKTLAHERLQKLILRVGMPKETVDYGPLSLSANYMQNKMAIANFDNQQWVNSIGGNVRAKWKASLLTPNAFYMPGDHAIEIPSVMFMPPFFDSKGEDAINFAGIGMVIGHEVFHSISGQLPTLENPEMKKQVEQFKTFNSGLGTLDGWGTDGKRTFNEDVADLGGVMVAYSAWKATVKASGKAPAKLIDGYTPDQRFFIALGRVWRSKWRGTVFNQDVHGAPFARVNSMVMHMPEFAKAFGCKDTDPMVLTADKMTKIW